MTTEQEWMDQVRQQSQELTARAAPMQAWQHIAKRVSNGDVVILPVEETPEESGSRVRAIRVAAIVLLFATAVAGLVPGVPIAFFIRKALGFEPKPAEPTAPAPVAPATMPETTLIIDPVDGRVLITVEQAAPGVRIRMRIADASQVEVKAAGTAVNAQFRSAAGRLSAIGVTGGELTLTVPRSLARMRVEVNGTAYFTKENAQIRILAPAADTSGADIILAVPAAR